MLHYSIHKAKKENASWITFIHGAGGAVLFGLSKLDFFQKL